MRIITEIGINGIDLDHILGACMDERLREGQSLTSLFKECMESEIPIEVGEYKTIKIQINKDITNRGINKRGKKVIEMGEDDLETVMECIRIKKKIENNPTKPPSEIFRMVVLGELQEKGKITSKEIKEMGISILGNNIEIQINL